MTKEEKQDKKLKSMLSKCKILLQIENDDNSQDELLTMLLLIAENECIATLYPFNTNYDEIELPNRYDLWIVQTVKYLYDSKDFSNLIKYSENGIEMEFNSESIKGIPKEHYSQLIPYASGIHNEQS